MNFKQPLIFKEKSHTIEYSNSFESFLIVIVKDFKTEKSEFLSCVKTFNESIKRIYFNDELKGESESSLLLSNLCLHYFHKSILFDPKAPFIYHKPQQQQLIIFQRRLIQQPRKQTIICLI